MIPTPLAVMNIFCVWRLKVKETLMSPAAASPWGCSWPPPEHGQTSWHPVFDVSRNPGIKINYMIY